MHSEDAESILIRFIRERPKVEGTTYGYDIYIPTLIRWHLALSDPSNSHPSRGYEVDKKIQELSATFYVAAWELCRRGIIRPGVRRMGLQATEQGNGGDGYSITPFGEQWAAESDRDDFVPTEPQRFAEMLKPFEPRFGPGFYERAQEAVRCYGAHAYLSCCAMCGAAAESILLATAIAHKDEQTILKAYSSAGGRSRVQTQLLGQAPESIKREFDSLSVLLKYWRDEAAHGKASHIADNEAYTSLALLLRLAQFVDHHWDALTRTRQ